MTDDKIKEIESRWAAAKPGPWYWDMSCSGHYVQLVSKPNMHTFVFDTARWGMQGATLRFNTEAGMTEALFFKKPRKAYNQKHDLDIDHPDAVAIAHAPEDVAYLLNRVRELEAKLSA